MINLQSSEALNNPNLATAKVADEGSAKIPAVVEVNEKGVAVIAFNVLDVLRQARPSRSNKDVGVFLTVPSIDVQLGGSIYRLALGQGGGWLSTRKAK